jgi:uncharacterized membrane protein
MAASPGESRIITIDAPGAGKGQYQGTGCFANTDCSVLLNNFGVVTGYYLDANNVFYGFVRSPDGKFTSFQAPGADTTAQHFNGTVPNAINDAGAIAGGYWDVQNQEHGFLRSPEGEFQTFDVPGGTPGTTLPIALNIEGAIVGYYIDKSGGFQGFLRNPDGTFASWTAPGGCTSTPADDCYGTAAFGINLFGVIAGGYEDDSVNLVSHNFIRSPRGKFTAQARRGRRSRSMRSAKSRATTLTRTISSTGTYVVPQEQSQPMMYRARARMASAASMIVPSA